MASANRVGGFPPQLTSPGAAKEGARGCTSPWGRSGQTLLGDSDQEKGGY